jgi:hypothetical protein
MSLNGRLLNPARRGTKGFWYFALGVADKAAKVLP